MPTPGEIKKEVDALERKTGPSGAVPNDRKTDMLDFTDVEKRHPDKHIRLVNVSDSTNVGRKQRRQYERLPAEQGGKQVGNLVLFAQPKAEHERRLAENKRIRESRLSVYKDKQQQLAEGMARELRDKHGLHIDPERLIRG
jgi:hypothetical protein